MNNIQALLGGSFNPPHFGHLLMAQAVADQSCAKVALMPSHNPLKDKLNDARLQLLELAVAEFNQQQHSTLAIEPFELNAHTYPTYTLDTLQALKQQKPDTTLIFVIGQDSFENLPKWKGGFGLLDYCHLWVFGRGDGLVAGEFCQIDELFAHKNGKIYWDNSKIPDISSTYIRDTLKHLWQNGADLSQFFAQLGDFLPKRVLNAIFAQKLYQN